MRDRFARKRNKRNTKRPTGKYCIIKFNYFKLLEVTEGDFINNKKRPFYSPLRNSSRLKRYRVVFGMF